MLETLVGKRAEAVWHEESVGCKWGRHEGSNGAVCFESVGLVVVAR